MLTTTGLPLACAFFTASRIWSDAVTEPPGESTRSTMALMLGIARRLADRLRQIVAGDAGAGVEEIALRGAVDDLARRFDHRDIGADRRR